MNDRFKFRAKLKDIDNWVFGAYLKMLPYQPNPVGHRKPLETEYKHLIITEGPADWGMPREIASYEVIPETVGQCTGLKDKNGTLIYEGDIVKETVVDYIDEEFLTVVCWSNLKASYNIDDTVHCEREVIGNIYENKELLDERN